MNARRAWKEGRRHTLVWALALLLALLTTVPGMAQSGPNTMSFQGRLLDSSGDPRGGEKHCMRFRMCTDDSNCGSTQVWPASGFEEHNVTTESGTYKGGLFNVTLGKSSSIPPALLFDYDRLYVEIYVSHETSCSLATNWSRMSPLSQIQTSAYAQRSRRVHTRESDEEYLVRVENTGQGGAVYAETDSTSDDAAAGHFLAAGNSGATYGVYAENDSTSDYAKAGYFHADGTSGQTYGVYVVNESTDSGAKAGYFHADGSTGYTYGVYAKNDSTSDYARAGDFRHSGTSGATMGVHVLNESLDSDSVAGYFRALGGDIIEGYGNSNIDRKFVVQNDGDVYADGSFSSPAADFAEMLPGADDLEPGDVLVVGLDGDLARSSEAHQTSVVGVYSTDPGFVGGSDEAMDNPGKVPLAIVGVVPCKASAENGAIRPGDLLVTSSTPGHAMHAGDDPPQGTVVGKALEGLESGSGVIQMLVTLQ